MKDSIQITASAKPFWAMSTEETLDTLKSTKEGLANGEAVRRIGIFGPNVFGGNPRLTRFKIFVSQFKSPLIFILFIAGGITLYLGKWVDTSVIFLALSVNAILGFYQENRAEAALERLKLYIKERARVIRADVEREIDAEKIVPGDIVHVSYGTRIPADARLISIKDLSVDESILTGESMPVSKDLTTLSEAAGVSERKNMIFGGTLVVEGYATAVITATGNNTEIGKIASLVSETKRQKTPLQNAVSKLAWIIAVGASALVVGIFALGISRGEDFFNMFLISAAVAVGAIPEALPVALTVILAVGVEQLAKRKGIVRNLAAAETLGSTTLIMTDKTGTLTRARMELVDVATIKHIIAGTTRDHKPAEHLTEDEKNILKLAFLNADVLIENPHDQKEKWRLIGRPLETHIVAAAAKHGIDVLSATREGGFHIALPFNSKNKFSVSFVHSSGLFHDTLAMNESFLTVLGAPDILLSKSNLTKDDYVRAMNTIETLSGEGKRILGVAIKPAGARIQKTEKITAEHITNLEFVGILAFYDPIRPEIPAAMKRMESFGITVVMATGDLKGTALSVGKEIGWNVSPGEILTGEEMEKLTDEQLLAHLEKIKIFARVTPENKLRIALLYKQRGEVVAMTGDGVNDAPSLKATDIGVAVGSGSDVAKEVADLVILDDNFNTIVAAIEEGRRILGNIRKTFVYLMSNSLDEVVLIGMSLFAGLPLPLTALQIIWVNFFTGSLPSLAFAFENTVEKSNNAKESGIIINAEVKFLTLGIGVLTSFLLFLLYWILLYFNIEITLAKTFLFACFASYILFIAFSFKSLKHPLFSYNIFSNRFLTWGVGAGVVLIGATIYIPALQNVFNTVALPPVWLLALSGWIALNIILVEAAKWVYRNV